MEKLTEEAYYNLLDIARKTLKRNGGFDQDLMYDIVHDIIASGADLSGIEKKIVALSIEKSNKRTSATMPLKAAEMYQLNRKSIDHKRCKSCGEPLPVSEFYQYVVRGKITTATRCKPCLSKKNTENYKKDIHRRIVIRSIQDKIRRRYKTKLKQTFLLTGKREHFCRIHGQLPINRFTVNVTKGGKIVLNNYCDKCITQQVKEYQKNNPESVRASREKIKNKYKTDPKWRAKERAKKNKQSAMLTANYIRRMIILERSRKGDFNKNVSASEILERRERIIRNRTKRREKKHKTLPRSITEVQRSKHRTSIAAGKIKREQKNKK